MYLTHKLNLPDTTEGRVRAAEMLLERYVPELCMALRRLDAPDWVFAIMSQAQIVEERARYGEGVVPPCDGMALLSRHSDGGGRQVVVTVRGDLVGVALGDYLPADRGGLPGVAAISLITHGLAANADYAAEMIRAFREAQDRMHNQFAALYPAGTINYSADTDLATVVVQGQG